jgi:hypothetical protein
MPDHYKIPTKHQFYLTDEFDCRRYIKPGDAVKFHHDNKDNELSDGIFSVLEVYEQFVVLKGNRTNITVNRWDIESVNGYKITGGCFSKLLEVLDGRI